MNKKPRKFFVLKSLKNQSIGQCEAKLKKTVPESSVYSDVVFEAERIVNKYMENLGYHINEKNKKTRTLKNLAASSLIFGVVLSAAYMIIKMF